ncbi:hypothetical protein [Streptomyces montanisoli]|uniref:Uncharacterized protein n=1 Tax=Streptomyces montanisoli TaxID=2798581 RepID=A0A940M824_9ACTN|nr:hypothetical protein [Streptomyces montanisoli]MBP0457934.1 hypothetical protein [Streptomyces montanisoli]
MAEDPGNDVTVGTIGTSRVIAASVTTGRERLGTVDDFVANLSDFDRRARVCLADPGTDTGTPLYLDYITAQVMAWTKDELDLLSRVTGEIDTLLADRWPGLLPTEVHLVKTTGQEESRAAYTRHTATVVLPAGKITPALGPSPGGDPLFPRSNTTGLRDILLHELFHVISKNSPERRKALYRLVGYTQLDAVVPLPDVPWPAAGCAANLPDLRITNPDAPGLDVYITLPVPRSPQEAGGARELVERPLLPLLAADRPYGGGSFFDYLTWSFLELRRDGTGWAVDTTPDGRPVVHPMVPGSALWQAYLDRVGRNVRGELFHPDEICASNFVHAALLPSAALLTSMDHVLAGSRR